MQQKDINDQLVQAASLGDIDTIERLFSRSPAPNVNAVTADSKSTALNAAASNGHDKVVQYLVSIGADVQYVDRWGNTAAHEACWSLNSVDTDATQAIAILRTLSDKDRSILDAKNHQGHTCLHFVARIFQLDLVSWLLEAGADAAIRDNEGKTPWNLVADHLTAENFPSFYKPSWRKFIIDIYRAFVSCEFKAGSVEALRMMQPENIGGLHVYQIPSASVLLEQLADRGIPIEACHQIAREFRYYIRTSNGLAYREPSCIFETHGSRNNTNLGKKTQPLVFDYLSLVMPFIYLKSPDAQQSISRRTRISQKYLQNGLKYCDANQTDLHVFHGALTLDEYCYPALSESVLTYRNTDQALLRLTLGSMNRETIVLVDQIWAWQIQDMLVYTNLNTRPRDDFSWSDAYSGTYTEIAVLLADFIESNDVNRVFDMFQEAIVNLAEEVGEYLTKTGVESIGIDDEKGFYHKINDIREELSMLRRILSQQEEVWKDFASNAWPEIWADCQDGRIKSSPDGQVEDRRRLMRLTMRPWRRIQKSQRRISQLDEDAERVERSIAIQLDLKQKHATLKEAHATAVMSAAVFGFTIITIIFTPLSFVMSLFALPIDILQASQIVSRWTGDAGMYSTHYIGTWAATTEIIAIFLTLGAMWLALRYGLDYHIGPKLWKALQSILSLPAQALAYLKRSYIRKSKGDKNIAAETSTDTSSSVEAV